MKHDYKKDESRVEQLRQDLSGHHLYPVAEAVPQPTVHGSCQERPVILGVFLLLGLKVRQLLFSINCVEWGQPGAHRVQDQWSS